MDEMPLVSEATELAMSKSNNGQKADSDNHANQLNPNNDAYWSSRGESGPPDSSSEGDGTRESPPKDKK